MSTDPQSRKATPAGPGFQAARSLKSPPELSGAADPVPSPIAVSPPRPPPSAPSGPSGPSGPIRAFGTGAFKPKPPPVPKGGRRLSQSRKFCKCIKDVRKTVKARRGSSKEKGAIAICVKSVLQKKGRTLKKFKCGRRPRVLTQRRLH